MAKTIKCMDICVEGINFVCTFTPSDRNPYRLYHQWHDNGKHRKLLEAYADFSSVIEWLRTYGRTTRWGYQDVFPERSQA